MNYHRLKQSAIKTYWTNQRSLRRKISHHSKGWSIQTQSRMLVVDVMAIKGEVGEREGRKEKEIKDIPSSWTVYPV